MKILSLRSVNTYSYSKLSLTNGELSSVGVTFVGGSIVGTPQSNGAGKTTIAKVLFYAITGKDLYGGKLSDITNQQNSSSGHFAEVVIEATAGIIKIRRFYEFVNENDDTNDLVLSNGKKKRSGSELYINDELLKFDKETSVKSAIESAIGMSAEMLELLVISPQLKGVSFLTADNKQEILSAILDLSRFSAPLESVKKYIKDTEKSITEQRVRLASITEQSEALALDEARLSEQASKFMSDRQTAHDRLVTELTSELEANAACSCTDEARLSEIGGLLSACSRKKSEVSNSIDKLHKKALSIKETVIKQSEAPIELMAQSSKIDSLLSGALAKQQIARSEIKQAKSDLIDLTKPSSELLKYIGGSEISNKITEISENEARLIETQSLIQEVTSQLLLSQARVESLKIELDALGGECCPTCQTPWEDAKHGDKAKTHGKISNDVIQESNKSLVLTKKLSELTNLAETLSKSVALKEPLVSYKKRLDIELKLTVAIQEESLATSTVESLSKERAALESRLRGIQNSAYIAKKESAGQLNDIEFSISELKASLVDLSERESSLNAELTQIRERLSRIKERGNTIMDSIEKSKMSLLQSNPYDTEVLACKEKLRKLSERFAVVTETLSKLDTDLKYAEFWRIGFSDAGIKSFMTESVLSEITKETNVILSELTNTPIKIEFLPESETRAGSVVNKIIVRVSESGEERIFSALGGGIQRRAMFASNLAIRSVALRRMRIKPKFWFLDEPFDGMDTDGQVRALRILKDCANETGTTIMLVSHDSEVGQYCDSKILVKRVGQTSAIG